MTSAVKLLAWAYQSRKQYAVPPYEYMKVVDLNLSHLSPDLQTIGLFPYRGRTNTIPISQTPRSQLNSEVHW